MSQIIVSKESLRIIHIITTTSVGGAEQTMKKLIMTYSSNIEVLVVSLTGVGPIGDDLAANQVHVESLNVAGLLSAIKGFFRLRKILSEFDPDIVQTWMYHADLFGGVCAYFTGFKRIIWGIRRTGFYGRKSRTYFLMKICAFLSYVIPKKVVCVSHSAEEAHSKYGYDRKKMTVVHNGINSEVFNYSKENREKIRKELGVCTDDEVVGVVGRFHFDKGLDIFVDAAAAICANHQTARFLLVGRGCDESNYVLMKQIESLNLQKHFILLGERKDIPEILSALDVYCMTSRTEGFPNGLVEAMATEVPCIATNVGDVQKIATPNMMLINSLDPHEVSFAMNEMLRKPRSFRVALGKEERKKVEDVFSVSAMKGKFYSLYAQVMDEKRV